MASDSYGNYLFVPHSLFVGAVGAVSCSGTSLEKIIGAGLMLATPVLIGGLGMSEGVVYVDGKRASKSVSRLTFGLASSLFVAVGYGATYLLK